jgi:hypothetical protein
LWVGRKCYCYDNAPDKRQSSVKREGEEYGKNDWKREGIIRWERK